MTDNEIIKALKCCITDKCIECPFFNIPKKRGCMKLTEIALDLINRQEAEIERLQKIRAKLSKEIERIALMTVETNSKERVGEQE